eukprot:TRINITY_DN14624_c0_g1_i6.p1 TRINITY_DN14624_c0_g1~~TRINITY_DN14624_c0_g1_i6.p1  ORF type:complete len:560 (-),score=85.69 TRINITY_DN14624_c0_g1_i6:290-1969(-)
MFARSSELKQLISLYKRTSVLIQNQINYNFNPNRSLQILQPNVNFQIQQNNNLNKTRQFCDDNSTDSKGWKFLQQFINYERQKMPDRNELEVKFKLDRVRNLLKIMGDPQKNQKIIHVAGTKGQGSPVSFVSNILLSLGYKVGTYSSPHILNFRERIQIGNQLISVKEMDDLVEKYGEQIEGVKEEEKSVMGGPGDLSFFEVFTALAFRYFADKNVDWIVLETGLGGELDATNVVDAQDVYATVLTKIDYDHMVPLGNDIKSIASAKAGIIKRNTPVIISHQKYQEALDIFREYSDKKESGIVIMAEDQVKIVSKGYEIDQLEIQEIVDISYDLKDKDGVQNPVTIDNVRMKLLGSHQHQNIATAVTTINQLFSQDNTKNCDLMIDSFRRGLQNAWMYGRFQVMPISRRDGDTRRIILDGAHTEESATAMAKTLKQVFGDNPLVIIVAMSIDKEHGAVMQAIRSQLSPICIIFTTVAIGGEGSARSCPPGTLTAAWQIATMKTKGAKRCREMIQGNMKASIDRAQNELDGAKAQDGLICVTGSMYAVAVALIIVNQLNS